MKNFILGILFGILLIIAGLYIFITRGGMPVPTASKPLPLEKFIANTAIRAAIGDQDDTPSPIDPTEPNLREGARTYRTQCAECHGLPHQEETAIAKGMFPKPPQLFPPHKGVTDDEVGETFWKVKNGIRLTGMPSYQQSLTETQMWQVSLLLQRADKLTPALEHELTGNIKRQR